MDIKRITAIVVGLAFLSAASVFGEFGTILLDTPFSNSATGPISEAGLNAGTSGGTWSVINPATSEVLGSAPLAALIAGWDFEQAGNSDRVFPAFQCDAVAAARFGVKTTTSNAGKGSSDGTWGSLSDTDVPDNTLENGMKFLSGGIVTHDLTLTVGEGFSMELNSLNFDMIRPSWSKAVHEVTVIIVSSSLEGVADGTQLVSFTDSSSFHRDVDVDLTGLSDRVLLEGESITLRFEVVSSKADAYFIDNTALFGNFEAISDRVLSAGTGPFDVRLNLDEPWVNDGKSFLRLSFKLAAHNFNTGEQVQIRGLDSSSNEFFTVTYNDARTVGALRSDGTYQPAGDTADDQVSSLDAYDSAGLKTVTVKLNASTLDLQVANSDSMLSDFAYRTTDPPDLVTLVISGSSGAEAFIDDIRLVRKQAVAETGPLSDVVGLWQTAPDGLQIVERQPDLGFQPGRGSSGLFVDIETTERYQSIDGFGASLTDASAILIFNSPHRDEIMEQLFNPDTGIGMSLVRLPMGASDFSTTVWSYEDTQGSFNVDMDLQMRIPLLKQALAINPSLKIMGSPWSAPAWMKDGGAMEGGELLPQYVDDYAQYFVNFVQAYEAEGLPIWAVTIQNEPQHGTTKYPSMVMSPAQHAELAKAIGAAFAANNISTKIIAFDHNYDIGESYVNAVYSDAEAYAVLDGSAWHQYGGNADSMGSIWQAYPEKGVYFTERTGEKNPFFDNMHYFFNNIFFDALNNGARCVMTWNIAVDENGGPRLPTVTWATAAGMVEYQTTDDTWTLYPEYAAIGHYGRFVRPGAVRIGANPSNSNLQTTAFKNVDGTVAVVVYNNTGSLATFDLNVGGEHLTSSLDHRHVATFLFHELDDLDGNGIPDRWELEYFGDWGIDPALDSDGDGSDNRSEYIAGTDPTNPNIRLGVSIVGSPDDLKIMVSPAVRSDFRSWGISTSTNLIDWFPHEGSADSGTATSELFDLPVTNAPVNFYRAFVTFP